MAPWLVAWDLLSDEIVIFSFSFNKVIPDPLKAFQ